MVTCIECGSEMVSARGNHKFLECGLDYVELVDVETRKCTSCMEEELVLPDLPGLHQLLARIVAELPGPLAGQEIAFLRKWLGFSTEDFATEFMVNSSVVRAWENNRLKIQPEEEDRLRKMVNENQPVDYYPREESVRLAPAEPKSSPVRLYSRGAAWQSFEVAACGA